MDSQFWIWGGVVSIVSHGVLLAALLAFGCFGEHQGAVADEKPRMEESEQAETPTVPTEAFSKPETPPPPPRLPVREYEVQAGDTLVAIARRIGCSVERLAKVNESDVKTLSRLRIGQKLVLPD